MKMILFSILGLLTFYSKGFAQKTISDPNVELREVKNFHAIMVSSAFDIYLTQSNEESVAVSASELKFRDRVITEVKEGVLIIRYDNRDKWNTGNKKLKAYISFKQLEKLNITGACDVYIIDRWKAGNLKIELAGASNLKGKINAEKLMVELRGASDMTISGDVAQLNIEAGGASDFKGFDLVVDYCYAKASGASEIKITVNRELTAEASGASEVKYKGNGLIREVKTSGASSISKKS